MFCLMAIPTYKLCERCWILSLCSLAYKMKTDLAAAPGLFAWSIGTVRQSLLFQSVLQTHDVPGVVYYLYLFGKRLRACVRQGLADGWPISAITCQHHHHVNIPCEPPLPDPSILGG